ncbi:exported protein of unknown function [Magnetospira sp. QH-2]|nr:exported protein of unknown function [Magnetospira sp. QH-2]
MRITLLALTGVMGVVACQTIPPNPQQHSSDLTSIKRAIATRCVIVHGVDNPAATKTKVDLSGISVRSVAYSERGWIRAEATTQGINGYVYMNPEANQVVCGQNEWERKNLPFVKVTQTEFESRYGMPFGGTSSRSVDSSLAPSGGKGWEERPLAFSWDGFDELIAGTVRIKQNSKTGYASISLPNGEGICSGTYKIIDPPYGTWSLTCSNGLTAKGSLKAFGAGKGAAGEGEDSKNRKIKFTTGGSQSVDSQQTTGQQASGMPTIEDVKEKMHLGQPLTAADRKVLADYYNKHHKP